MASAAIVVEGLVKVYRHGLTRKRVDAVRGIAFEVATGQVFGFLGPNGAGKTTTIKVLTGLIEPSAGQASIFGHPVASVEARRRIGFLPENPYVYPFLTPAEFVELCGRLSGMSGKAARDRTRRVLDRVGILYAAERPVRRLSKGMLQRTGLAAALVADPELLILDEPMSGLDPVGRKEVKDIVIEERAAGRTVFFSTHILSDVESLCDRVAILRRGEVVVSGTLSELLRGDVQRTEVTLAGASPEFETAWRERGAELTRLAERSVIALEGRDAVRALVREAVLAGFEVVAVTPRHETLEDLFVRKAIDEAKGDAPVSRNGAT
ncbi:MAG TPA: ABC transporter ATP-binding protein [Polyangiaceae bacterium]|jgi:ABC-2 type transport system ATP-binding protein